MTDADIVREWIGGCHDLHGFREDCRACVAYREANDALDRLDALVAEAQADAKSKYEQGWHDATIAARGRAARDERRYG